MLRALAFATIALPCLAACAAYGAAAPQFTAGQIGAVHAVCADVMRLRPGEAQYDGCVDSLSQMVAGEILAGASMAAYQDCDHEGEKRGTPEYARCVLDREGSESNPGPASKLGAGYVRPVANDTESYFHSDFAQRRRREEYACADMNQMPGTSGFISCVDNLQATLFDLDHPAD